MGALEKVDCHLVQTGKFDGGFVYSLQESGMKARLVQKPQVNKPAPKPRRPLFPEDRFLQSYLDRHPEVRLFIRRAFQTEYLKEYYVRVVRGNSSTKHFPS